MIRLRHQPVHHLDDERAVQLLGASDQVVATGPSTTKAFVRPNKYQAGRAFIVVYNFALQATVDVDLSNVLTPGNHFEIRNVQDVFGVPVA